MHKTKALLERFFSRKLSSLSVFILLKNKWESCTVPRDERFGIIINYDQDCVNQNYKFSIQYSVASTYLMLIHLMNNDCWLSDFI